MKACRGLVAGKVQGVWFRKSVQQGCLELGLAGYARNLADGRVEVVLVGHPDRLEQGKLVVANGSPGSRVESLDWTELMPPPEITGFSVL